MNDLWSGEGVFTMSDGSKRYESCRNGHPYNCKYREEYASGKLKEEATYVDSLLQGKTTDYYEDGTIKAE